MQVGFHSYDNFSSSKNLGIVTTGFRHRCQEFGSVVHPRAGS
ncbi:hypothetical protein [Paraburkholderia sp. CNPSo 3272]|nr:hypothetical protein [Paraburkholderia sp. CNPSo 3272]